VTDGGLFNFKGRGLRMKRGAILYVLGEEYIDNGEDLEDIGKKLNIEADMIEVVSSMDKNFDVMYAWWFLTTKGMKSITCLAAELVDHTKIKLTGRELRLCG
jgi:3-mercaptopyruvate sulfurtransferase SseA